ncbi:LacI family DNA-binding transcriptional regulator [Nonomuraea sp. NPDC049400]|uniref:LacI family DNA-binding transcriptional regulator n=1 Tax=Nonomuraea sp. NPDC049400 TaxID=3364352 RepID=UPI0037AA646A
MRPTIEQVAAHAGVGRSTVSRVLNGSPKVRQKTRLTVQKAIEELRYTPNRAARSLVTRRTDTVALVISESPERVFSDPFFAGVVRGIAAQLTSSGKQLLMTMARSTSERSALEAYLGGGHVDGVLLLSLHHDDPLPSHLVELGVPAVLGGRPLDPALTAHVVDVDNQAGAYLAVRHLIERGRRRIATITGPMDMLVSVHRLGGYRDGLTGAGIEESADLVAGGDFSERSGAEAMRALLARRPDLDAVFAASDLMALGALRVLREAGRADVAVVGFDDSPLAEQAGLTSVHQPVEDMGREMVRLLLMVIGGGTPSRFVLVLTPHLVTRETS